jgi:hypothetical protein
MRLDALPPKAKQETNPFRKKERFRKLQEKEKKRKRRIGNARNAFNFSSNEKSSARLNFIGKLVYVQRLKYRKVKQKVHSHFSFPCTQ